MILHTKGFSLIELLMALAIALVLSMMTFQLFHQNERVIRDQTLIMEMQQTARIVASQIADEIRMAGQGVPVYAAQYDSVASEAAAVILPTSTANRIDFRAGLSNVETLAARPGPTDLILGVSRTLAVGDGSGFSSSRFAYLSEPTTWLRAEVTSATSTALTITPSDTGSNDTIIHFETPPNISLEEAVSIYLSAGSVRRATASDTANAADPAWSAANEIGKNFRALTFTYYDIGGNIVSPTLLANRLTIARVDINLTVETSGPLSDGSHPAYSLALRTIPRNVRIRSAN